MPTRLLEILVLFFIFPGLAAAAPKIEHWVTENGARAYFIETHALPMVDINLVFNAASAREPADRQGLAKLTSDMLLEGSGDLDSKAIAEGFEDRGAEVGSSSHRDMAIVSLRSLSDKQYLDPVVDLLTTVISDPSFPEKSLEREKARSLQSLDHSLQQPNTVGKRLLYESLYKGHPYANHPAGTHESLKSISRDDLVAFHRQFYVASNMVIAVVGDLNTERLPTTAWMVILPLIFLHRGFCVFFRGCSRLRNSFFRPAILKQSAIATAESSSRHIRFFILLITPFSNTKFQIVFVYSLPLSIVSSAFWSHNRFMSSERPQYIEE